MALVLFREVSVALQSVFQPSELEAYVKMSKREKEEQLMELMCIVAGIRLFNRDCQRGGEGIDDRESFHFENQRSCYTLTDMFPVPVILQEAVKKSHDSVVDLLERLMLKIYRFTAAVEKTICYWEVLPFGVFTVENLHWLIGMLAACRQQEIYVRFGLC